MILQTLHCPHCHGTDLVRHGTTRQGKQRYRCREQHCAGRTFLLDYSYPGQSPEVKQQIVEMAMNASGIRDTARGDRLREPNWRFTLCTARSMPSNNAKRLLSYCFAVAEYL